MLTNPKSLLLLFSIVFLVLAKLTAIIHIDLENGYWDLDRTIALLLFLVLFFSWYERFQFSSTLILGATLIVSWVLDLLFLDIGFLIIVQLLLFTALIEEILLRGVVFELLLKKLSPIAVIISSSVFFTVVHPAIYDDMIYALLVLFTGLILGSVYIYFRNDSLQKAVIISTAVHMLIILLGLYLEFI